MGCTSIFTRFGVCPREGCARTHPLSKAAALLGQGRHRRCPWPQGRGECWLWPCWGDGWLSQSCFLTRMIPWFHSCPSRMAGLSCATSLGAVQLCQLCCENPLLAGCRLGCSGFPRWEQVQAVEGRAAALDQCSSGCRALQGEGISAGDVGEQGTGKAAARGAGHRESCSTGSWAQAPGPWGAHPRGSSPVWRCLMELLHGVALH